MAVATDSTVDSTFDDYSSSRTQHTGIRLMVYLLLVRSPFFFGLASTSPCFVSLRSRCALSFILPFLHGISSRFRRALYVPAYAILAVSCLSRSQCHLLFPFDSAHHNRWPSFVSFFPLGPFIGAEHLLDSEHDCNREVSIVGRTSSRPYHTPHATLSSVLHVPHLRKASALCFYPVKCNRGRRPPIRNKR